MGNKMMNPALFRFVNLILFSLILIIAKMSLAQNFDSSHDEKLQLSVKHKINNQDIKITVTEMDASEESFVTHLVDQLHDKANIVITTDNQEVLQKAIESSQKNSSNYQIKLIPFGRILSPNSKINQFINYQSEKVRNNLKKDKIGLTIAFITFGIDSYYWIHSSALDVHQKSSLVTFNLMLFLTFGVNPELWPSVVQPAKIKLMRLFDQFQTSNNFINGGKLLVSQYVANLLLSSSVQTTRVALLSMDQILTSFQSSHFWGTAIGTAALASLSQFSWSEMSASIDSHKYPKSVIMLRRLNNFRSLIMSRFASISQVLQPNVYGYSSIGVMITHAAIGVVAVFNTDKIIQFLEGNRYVDVLYRKNQKIEQILENMTIKKMQMPNAMTCESLFF